MVGAMVTLSSMEWIFRCDRAQIFIQIFSQIFLWHL